MKRTSLYYITLAAILSAAVIAGCSVKYSFTGASIPEEATTISIGYFPNNAPTVTPTLSSMMTDALKDRFARQTKLEQVGEGEGDISFQGEIIGYATAPATVSATAERATSNRLTVTVRVSFVNIYAPQWNFNNKTFSAYQDYDATMAPSDGEAAILPDIIEEIVDKIYTESVANW